ncbi:MAG: SHOCT domain-containing protein [Xanthobacteraceae bacterium]
MLEPILIVGIVMACTAWYVQHKWRKRARTWAAMQEATRDPTGLGMLAKRYARGDIDRDEYLQKRNDILAATVAPQPRS